MLTQLVKVGIDTLFYHPSLIDQQRRIIVYLLVDAVANGLADIELIANTVQTWHYQHPGMPL